MPRPLIPCILLLSAALTSQAQESYRHDRVFTANQVSNTVSVIDPSTREHLGEIILGKPQPGVLSPLYKGQSLVHGLRYEPRQKLLAVVSIGSNAVSLINTETNQVLATIYVGRAPHEPTFTPNGKELWVTVRGEAHLSVIDVTTHQQVRKIPVSDGPGMIAFSKDGKQAFVASSFTPTVDVVDTATYEVIKKIPVQSPFSPNIYTSPDGSLVAMTHKDVGQVTILDPAKLEVARTFATGPLTNHVSFCETKGRLLLVVTVGGENCLKVFDVADDFKQTGTIPVGSLPHGLWPSPDGKFMFVGLEYSDEVQPVDMEAMKALPAIRIGQSPQALLYASNAATGTRGHAALAKLPPGGATRVITLQPPAAGSPATGRLAVRSIGPGALVEHLFTRLNPDTAYIVVLAIDATPGPDDREVHAFVTDTTGKYAGHSTGVPPAPKSMPFTRILVLEKTSRAVVLSGEP